MATVTLQTDGIGVSGGSASATYGPVNLVGGYYGISVPTLTGSSPSLQLEKLLVDRTTVNVGSASPRPATAPYS
jgi:hypothetical protein